MGLTQGSRYVQPEMATFIGALSAALFHPLPALIVAVLPMLVNVGAGSVTKLPVGVYTGKVEREPPVLNVAGGQAAADVALAGMLPAPAPPVCQAARGGLQGFVLPHVPMAARGSVGIHPFSSPSWYDQAGDSTVPDTLEFPIFHVQKK